MPAHSDNKSHAHASGHTGDAAHSPNVRDAKDDEGLVDKMKNLFRRSSKAESAATNDTDATAGGGGAGAGAGGGHSAGTDRIVDQTAGGQTLAPPGAAAAGATNLNSSAETAWPGVIQGQKLQAVHVPLAAIDKAKVTQGGGNKEGFWVNVPVHNTLGTSLGTSDSSAKTGFIRLEFDKEWIGAKAEAELLHHHLTAAISDRAPAAQTFKLGSAPPTQGSHPNPGMDERRRSLGGGLPHPGPPSPPAVGVGGGASHPAYNTGSSAGGSAIQDIAPDESVSSGKKHAGEV